LAPWRHVYIHARWKSNSTVGGAGSHLFAAGGSRTTAVRPIPKVSGVITSVGSHFHRARADSVGPAGWECGDLPALLSDCGGI
jgi:hypothetical protein